MAKIIEFPGNTLNDIDPDKMLENTKGTLTHLVIMGYDKEGNEYFASSYGDMANTLWLVKRFERVLMDLADDKARY